MDISVCMIVKNEESVLEQCLLALQKLKAEIVVVDTGSEDRTVEIAGKYTDRVFYFQWINDFSAAKNYAVSKASNEFVLVVDADEILSHTEDFNRIKSLAEQNRLCVGRVLRINRYERDGEKIEMRERINRLFSRNVYRYEGAVHEQLVPVNKELDISAYNVDMAFLHTGYDGSKEFVDKKAQRNLEILMMMDQNDPYVIYQIGKSCYMMGKYGEAEQYFYKGLGYDLNPKLEYVQDMVETYGYTLLKLGRNQDALFLTEIYDEFAVTADFPFLLGLVYMNNEMFDDAVSMFEKAAEFNVSKITGCNSYKAFYNCGVICECLGREERAVQYYLKCKEYAPAIEGIKRIKEKEAEC